MTTFDQREEAFENKFAHDAEQRFKVLARRNQLLGLWAAEQLGLSAEQAERYAKELVQIGSSALGDEGVFAKIRADFETAKALISEKEFHEKISEISARCRKE